MTAFVIHRMTHLRRIYVRIGDTLRREKTVVIVTRELRYRKYSRADGVVHTVRVFVIVFKAAKCRE